MPPPPPLIMPLLVNVVIVPELAPLRRRVTVATEPFAAPPVIAPLLVSVAIVPALDTPAPPAADR